MAFRFFKEPKPQRKDLIEVTKPKIIFVDGQDECLFLDHMLAKYDPEPSNIEIIAYNGKDKFALNLDALLRQGAFEDGDLQALAVFQDADEDFLATHRSLKNIMNSQKLPEAPLANFTTGKYFGGLSYGVFIFPNNSSGGNLETLLMMTVSSRLQAVKATAYVDKHIAPSDKDTSKRKAQAYLSVQKQIRRGAGQGARNNYFDLSDDAIESTLAFLKKFIAI